MFVRWEVLLAQFSLHVHEGGLNLSFICQLRIMLIWLLWMARKIKLLNVAKGRKIYLSEISLVNTIYHPMFPSNDYYNDVIFYCSHSSILAVNFSFKYKHIFIYLCDFILLSGSHIITYHNNHNLYNHKQIILYIYVIIPLCQDNGLCNNDNWCWFNSKNMAAKNTEELSFYIKK